MMVSEETAKRIADALERLVKLEEQKQLYKEVQRFGPYTAPQPFHDPNQPMWVPGWYQATD